MVTSHQAKLAPLEHILDLRRDAAIGKRVEFVLS